MTKRPDPSGDERNALLHSLAAVGPSKPVGYLPLYAIEEFVQRTPETVAAARGPLGALRRGFSIQRDSCIKSGALYVYHRGALAALLQTNTDAVRAAGLPLDPDDFVARIAAVWFEENHPRTCDHRDRFRRRRLNQTKPTAFIRRVTVQDVAREDETRVAEHEAEQPDDPARAGIVSKVDDEAGKIDLRLDARQASRTAPRTALGHSPGGSRPGSVSQRCRRRRIQARGSHGLTAQRSDRERPSRARGESRDRLFGRPTDRGP